MNETNIEPIGRYLIIKKIERPNPSRIIIINKDKEDKYFDDQAIIEKVPNSLKYLYKKGDRILFNKFTEINFEGVYFLQDFNILALINK